MKIRLFNPDIQPEIKKFVLGILNEFGFPHNPKLDYDLENLDKYYKDQGGIFYILEDKQRII